ncbi:MAG: hypothetical protein DME33_08815 [Verrucomicrobia bacterium]|nr:MAG: hypothetical protein DME33_08815 [Verrucomicrobiota bacterium]
MNARTELVPRMNISAFAQIRPPAAIWAAFSAGAIGVHAFIFASFHWTVSRTRHSGSNFSPARLAIRRASARDKPSSALPPP